jgi:hypothetical protein
MLLFLVTLSLQQSLKMKILPLIIMSKKRVFFYDIGTTEIYQKKLDKKFYLFENQTSENYNC